MNDDKDIVYLLRGILNEIGNVNEHLAEIADTKSALRELHQKLLNDKCNLCSLRHKKRHIKDE